jgi:hypothetical protein
LYRKRQGRAMLNAMRAQQTMNVAVRRGRGRNNTRAGVIHIKKCSPMLGVNQYVPGARNRTLHAMCRSPENEQVIGPHSGSCFSSHNSSSLTHSTLLARRRPAARDK